MDPNTVSPSWVEHTARLHPGIGFVSFLNEDNSLSDPSDLFLKVTLLNLKRILSLPFGPFASLLAFEEDFIDFLDSFLLNRQRMNLNKLLFPLDVLVFSVLYRFVCQAPVALHFSPACKTTSLFGLHVVSLERLIRLLALYHLPGSGKNGVTQKLVSQWTQLCPDFDKYFSTKEKVLKTMPPAGIRALFETLNRPPLSINVLEDLFVACQSASDKSNLRACALLLGKTPSNSQCTIWTSTISPDVDQGEIFICLSEEEEEKVDAVSSLQEVCPHLSRYFCQRLLAACQFNVERAIACVMEGQIPQELAGLDFTQEEEEEEEAPKPSSSLLPPPPAPPPPPLVSVPFVKKTTTKLEPLDADLKTKLLNIYDGLYNDEYDDTNELGTHGEGKSFLVEEAAKATHLDVNGERRNAQGRLVVLSKEEEEEEARRVNKKKVEETVVLETPEQQALRLKRDRNRKEKLGNVHHRKKF